MTWSMVKWSIQKLILMLSNENIVVSYIVEELADWKSSKAFGHIKRGSVSSISNKVVAVSTGRLRLEQSCSASIYVFKYFLKL